MAFARRAAALALALSLAPAVRAQRAESLYERLGGRPAIAALVDDFAARVARDTRINWLFVSYAFSPSRVAAMKRDLVEQICEAAGGPCDYTGRSMRATHAEMGITPGARYDALAESFDAALDRFGVSAADRQRLLEALRSES